MDEEKKVNEEEMGIKEKLPENSTPVQEEIPQVPESYIPSDPVYDEDDDQDEEEFNEGLLTGEKYDLPKSKDGFIDTADGKVIDKENLSPYEIIKAVAEQTGTVIRKPNSGCKKCYGRGYMGKDLETGMPVPCGCIYPPKTDLEKMNEAMYDSKKMNQKLNHDQRRKMKKFYQKNFKKFLKQEIRKAALEKLSVSATDQIEEVTNETIE